MEFTASRTRSNLLKAFAGESQAIMRYAFSASRAKTENLFVIEWAFSFTAGQEREHAEVFYNLLNGQARENSALDATYPIANLTDSLSLLREAQHNEYQEYTADYATFAEIAGQEGFPQIEQKFRMIARIEQTHGDRFGRFADHLEQNTLFKAEREVKWMCLNCGHIHTGAEPPMQCPVCSHNQGYFLREDLIPFR